MNSKKAISYQRKVPGREIWRIVAWFAPVVLLETALARWVTGRRVAIASVILAVAFVPVIGARAQLFDDFENAGDAYVVYNNSGGQISAVNDAVDVHSGSRSLHIRYVLANPNWFYVKRNLDPSQNAGGDERIEFWLKGDGSANALKIEIKTADATTPPAEAGAFWKLNIPLANTNWHKVSIPFACFMDLTPKPPSSGLTNVYYFLFAVTGSDTGPVRDIFIDDLVSTTSTPPMPSTPFEWLLARRNGGTGLVRSFATPLADTAYTYDQALAVIAFTARGSNDQARSILSFLASVQEVNGSFVSAYDSSTGVPDGQSQHYVGNNSWVVMAINYYTYKSRDGQFLTMATNCAAWILQYQAGDGSVSMGPGQPAAFSVEHNLDAWSALYHLSKLTTNVVFRQAADRIHSWLETSAWLDVQGYFAEGKGGTFLSLDPNTYGILALGTSGETGQIFTRCFDTLTNRLYLTDNGLHGFTFDETAFASEGCVWLEGTAQAALCYAVAGNSAMSSALNTTVSNSIRPDGGIAYTTAGNGGGRVNTNSAAAPACWQTFFGIGAQVNPFRPLGTQDSNAVIREARISTNIIIRCSGNDYFIPAPYYKTNLLDTGSWSRLGNFSSTYPVLSNGTYTLAFEYPTNGDSCYYRITATNSYP